MTTDPRHSRLGAQHSARRRDLLIASCLYALLALAVAPGAALAQQQPASEAVTTATTVACSSKANERQHCAASTSAGVLMVKSTGPAACLLGKTWGYDDRGVWVLDGCSGEFAVAGVALSKAPEPARNGAPAPPALTPSNDAKPAPQPDSKADAKASEQTQERSEFGTYTPNLGFKLADTKYGDLNLSIYTYVRYLNQLGLDSTYEDAFGNTKSVQERQDIQLTKLQMKFLGWILNPKLRYFLYAWTSNANQGQGAQVVLAGNLNYTFNNHLTLGGGIRSLPGTRSVEGNFPFWPGVDTRMIADEFMRPSYTSGFWATGQIVDRLEYQVMVGNNMSTLGVPASRLDNGLNTFSSALIWFPTGDFSRGFSGQGWGDFEHHEKFSTRLALHVSRSDENKESQPDSEVFENTQLRLSDGSVIFTPDLFAPGITITDARWRMISLDGGFKYRGYSLEGEYFWRWLDNFRGENTQGLPGVFNHGFQLQGSAMVVPQILQAYLGHSRIFGEFGDPWDFRFGTNWFPFKSKVLRWNTEALYLYKSPVGYTSVPFAAWGQRLGFPHEFGDGFLINGSLEID